MARKKREQNIGNFLGKLLASRIVLIALLCAVLIGGAFYGAWYFFRNSRFFSINEIVVSEHGRGSFWGGESKLKKSYMGRNIFEVDPGEVAKMIKKESPRLETVIVRRVMPDRLEIDVNPREPIAFINTAGGLVIDKEGVVLGRKGNTEGLVEIEGIRFFFSAPPAGRKIDNAMLDKALTILKELRKKRITGKYPAKYVNVSDRNNVQLVVLDVTVKMGKDNFTQKIKKLKEILKDPDVNIEDIEYIDLRFEEAVISPKRR
ncbi:MAG: cell division protein FtsQ/DivIB [Candidatus Omnitrophota bacterium]